MATIPSIPDIRIADPQLRAILEAIKQIIEIREGLRGGNTSGDRFMPVDDIISLLIGGGNSEFDKVDLGNSGAVYFGTTRRLIRSGDNLVYQKFSSGAWSTTDTLSG